MRDDRIVPRGGVFPQVVGMMAWSCVSLHEDGCQSQYNKARKLESELTTVNSVFKSTGAIAYV